MLSSAALDQWQRQAHGPRVQAKAITYISQMIGNYEIFADVMETSAPTLEEINKYCHSFCTPDAHIVMLCRWWYDYEEWGELPHRVSERKRKLKAWNKGAQRNQILDDGGVLMLKRIVDGNPNYFLDEIAFMFGMESGKFVHYSTIRQCLVEKLGYSMKGLQMVAAQ